MGHTYANEHNQTMEFPKRAKRKDRKSRDPFLGAKSVLQHFAHFELNFHLNHGSKIISIVLKY